MDKKMDTYNKIARLSKQIFFAEGGTDIRYYGMSVAAEELAEKVKNEQSQENGYEMQ